MLDADIWNTSVLKPPQSFSVPTAVNANLKKRLTAFKEDLFKVIQLTSSLQCLNVEATALSRLLYKNYRALRKDKGFQHLKMIMGSLNKYLRMNLSDDVQLVRGMIPSRFSPLETKVDVPTRSAIGWLLCRIHAFAALFYRVFRLTKVAGKQLYGRLRLNWNPPVLLLALGITARIHVVTRFTVLNIIERYETLVPYVRTFSKTKMDAYKSYSRDLKGSLDSVKDLMAPTKWSSSAVDLTLQLIDLIDEDDEQHSQFIEIIKQHSAELKKESENPDLERLFEVVNLDTTSKAENKEEDIGELCDADGVITVIASHPATSSGNQQKKNSAKKKKNIINVDLTEPSFKKKRKLGNWYRESLICLDD